MLARVMMCYHLVNSFRAAKKHAVISVSLSEWLGGELNLITVEIMEQIDDI
jgi:hypothetical protein